MDLGFRQLMRSKFEIHRSLRAELIRLRGETTVNSGRCCRPRRGGRRSLDGQSRAPAHLTSSRGSHAMGESRWSKARCTRLDRGPSQESWRVSIIALGSGEALHVMRTDPKIASRFESHALPAW